MPFWSRRRSTAETVAGGQPPADTTGLPDLAGMIEVAERLGMGSGAPRRAADGTYQGAWLRTIRERKRELAAWTILSWGPTQSHVRRVQISRSGPTGTVRADEAMAYMFDLLSTLLPPDRLEAAGQWIAIHPRGGRISLGTAHLTLAASGEAGSERLDLTVNFGAEERAPEIEAEVIEASPVTADAVLAVGSAEGLADGGSMQMGDRSQHTLRAPAEPGRAIPQITYLALDPAHVALLQVTWFYPENRQLDADQAWGFLERTMTALLPQQGLAPALAMLQERRFGEARVPSGEVAVLEQHRSPTRSVGWLWAQSTDGGETAPG